MSRQELMLNDSANINFQYEGNLYKISANIHEGIIIVKKITDNKDEYKGIIRLKDENMPIQEAKIVRVKSDKEESENTEHDK